MQRSISSRPFIMALLILQLIPFILYPTSSFSPDSQEWWLPLLLAVLVLVADFELIFQRRDVVWPWNLIAFAQGFNIISRLMMLGSHAMVNVSGSLVFNSEYVMLSVLSMLISAFILWYVELPQVRMVMVRD